MIIYFLAFNFHIARVMRKLLHRGNVLKVRCYSHLLNILHLLEGEVISLTFNKTLAVTSFLGLWHSLSQNDT